MLFIIVNKDIQVIIIKFKINIIFVFFNNIKLKYYYKNKNINKYKIFFILIKKFFMIIFENLLY